MREYRGTITKFFMIPQPDCTGAGYLDQFIFQGNIEIRLDSYFLVEDINKKVKIIIEE